MKQPKKHYFLLRESYYSSGALVAAGVCWNYSLLELFVSALVLELGTETFKQQNEDLTSSRSFVCLLFKCCEYYFSFFIISGRFLRFCIVLFCVAFY